MAGPVTASASSPAEVVAVCPSAVLQGEGARWVQDGVALVRHGGTVRAFEALCPHAGASLADGVLRGGAVSCPQHGARFRLSDGKPLAGPARRALRVYDVEESGTTLVVRVRPTGAAQAVGAGRLVRLAGRLRSLRAR